MQRPRIAITGPRRGAFGPRFLVARAIRYYSGVPVQLGPADVFTLDCLRTQRRITLILHDQHPGVVLYQFVTRAEEVDGEFKKMALTEMRSQTLFDWMQEYFA